MDYKINNIIKNKLSYKSIVMSNILPIVKDIFIGFHLILVKVNNEEKFLSYLIDNNISFTKIKYEPFNNGNKIYTKNDLYLITLINTYDFNDFLKNITIILDNFLKDNKDCIDSTITHICKSNVNRDKIFYEIYDFNNDIKTLTNTVKCVDHDFLQTIITDYIQKINNLGFDDYRYINIYLYTDD